MKYSNLNKKGNEIYFDDSENAIDSLETALFLFNRNGNSKWKWIAISLQHSLYSFCISSLNKGNYERVSFVKGKQARHYLISPKVALNRIKKVKYYSYSNGTPREIPFLISSEEQKALDYLLYEIRNNFVHFIPKVESISINKLKEACSIALKIIDFIATKSNTITFIDFDDSQQRIKKSIAGLQSILK